MASRGRSTAIVAAPPSVVFDAITDIEGLPAWNAVMRSVVEQPADLVPGSEWVVEFHVLAQTWHSRARVEEIDRTSLRFTYRSCTDDGNPSFARWSWEVDEAPAGSRVTVSFELHPVTFWRRILLAKVRTFQLSRREVPASLRTLAAHVAIDLHSYRVSPTNTSTRLPACENASRHRTGIAARVATGPANIHKMAQLMPRRTTAVPYLASIVVAGSKSS